MVCAFAAAAAAALLATATTVDRAAAALPSSSDYDYNGLTTYCYWIKQGPDVSSFDYTYVSLEAKGSDCPLIVNIAQTTKGVIYDNSDVEYQFSATLNFDNNAFQMKQLEASVPDPTTKRPVQIAHANVHACSSLTTCDVFRDGDRRRISNQETSNFTDGKALFNQKVNYELAGEYHVFAHIVLPPKNARNETYQFVTFTTTTITSRAAATAAANKDSGSSTGVMIGAIVGAVAVLLAIVVGVIFYRRKKPAGMMAPGNDHFRHSGGYAPSNTAKSKASRLDWNGDPEFQFGHDRYQASMVSEYSKQPPALSASALMFQDNGSSRTGKQKTVSSGGSSHRSAGSPRNRRTQGVALPDHGIDTYDTYYHENDRYGGNSTMQSYTTDTSMGTSNAYPSDAHLYPPHTGPTSHRGYAINTGDAPYDRESDMSSLNDYEYGTHGHDHPDGLLPVSEMDRDSVASMGTVDFALPPPLPLNSALRPTGDSFRAEDVPNLASTKLAFNDDEISKQTVEYIDSLRQQNNYRDTEQASDYVSDFGSTNRTFDFRDSAQSDNVYGASYRSSTDDQFTDTEFRQMKRAKSNDSESYEF